MNKEENHTSGCSCCFVENVATTTTTTTTTENEMITTIVNEQKQSDDSSSCFNTSTSTSTTITKFQPRTIRPGSINSERRVELLPAYPLARSDNQHRILLLLSNVPNVDRDECENESYCGGNGFCPFQFKQYRYVEPIDSFMIDLYQDLFIEPSRKWKIPYSLIDYNLSRLRKSMELYTKQTNEPALSSLNELTTALEFFLQIDVDMFFMKTCNFRGSYPRLFPKKNAAANQTAVAEKGKKEEEEEGILCEAEPIASYGMTPCYQQNCILCQSEQQRGSRKVASDELLKRGGVKFSSNQLHRFVNKYEAILNCDANCITSNVIYALTCPCGQFDFIDSTSMSFHDRILKHRDENNRIIREFLIGQENIDHILKETSSSRSVLTLQNNNMPLYQHSPRCPLILQQFLDKNPEYWCLVPMSSDQVRVYDDALTSLSSAANAVYTATLQYQPESPTFVKKPRFFEAVLTNTTRTEENCIWLTKCIPKPPSGYRFARRQIEEQINFFKFKKEAHIRLSNFIDCYKYTIIAVLPDDCSHELRRFIEALFITHAETKLNTIGRLTHPPQEHNAWSSSTTFDQSNRGVWCEKLVRQQQQQQQQK